MANRIRRSMSRCLTWLTNRWQQRTRTYVIIGWITLAAISLILIKLAQPVTARNGQFTDMIEPLLAGLAPPVAQYNGPIEPSPAPTILILPTLVSVPDLAASPTPLPLANPPRMLLEPVRELALAARVPITATTVLTPTLEPLPVRVVRASQKVFEGEGHDLRGEPTLTGSKVDAILAHFGSPAMGTGPIWEKLSRQYGIDNAYALAFFIVESSAATDPAWTGRKPDGTTTHNVGNIVCSGYPRCYGRWRDYATWEEGIADWYRLIAEEYINARNVATIEDIVPIYAPAFENDVPRYIAGVLRRVAWFHGVPEDQWPPMPPPQFLASAEDATPTPTPTEDMPIAELPPAPGAVRMPDLVGMDIEEAYRVLAEQGITVGVVDKQGREHIPHLFDQVAPDTVVSSLPYVGDWIMPDVPVILAVRAPEEGEPTETPAQTGPAPTSPADPAMPIATPTESSGRIAQPLPPEVPATPTTEAAPAPTSTPDPVVPIEEAP